MKRASGALAFAVALTEWSGEQATRIQGAGLRAILPAMSTATTCTSRTGSALMALHGYRNGQRRPRHMASSGRRDVLEMEAPAGRRRRIRRSQTTAVTTQPGHAIGCVRG